MLASNLNRLFLHTKQYHFQFPIRFLLSYLANIRSNYCNPQIIYFRNSFFFLSQALHLYFMLQSPGGSYTYVLQIFNVLTFYFCFSFAFFMRISHFCHLTEKIILSSIQNIRNIFRNSSHCQLLVFFSNATGGKNGSGSN